MAQAFFEGARTSIDGRIERLQIQREDGTIRLDKEINQHNTIVDCGLDNILTVGGFAAGSNTNSKTFDIWNGCTYIENSYKYYGLMYDLAKWIRMLWFVQLGTDTEDTITTYDMTALVEPYYNSDGETYSQSHYIPTTGNTRVRGTTQESYIAGDVHATHRITSNSIKISEDNTIITEIAFFVGVNSTWETDWFSQKFNVGDMFCRIKLGENKVTLNKGERLVITYALTEYAGCTEHQAINDIHLTDSNDEPIKFKDSDGVEHTIGAIARAWLCDGRASYHGTHDSKLPGPFFNIAQTVNAGATYGLAEYTDNTNYGLWPNKVVFKPSVYAYGSAFSRSNIAYFCNTNYVTSPNYYNRGGTAIILPFLVCLNKDLYNNTETVSNIKSYNTFDKYGFPNINTQQHYYGSQILKFTGYWSDRNTIFVQAGRCNTNSTNPTPYNNYTGSNLNDYIHPFPSIKSYTRGTFYRDQEYVIPTYMPRIAGVSNTLPAPTGTSNIYWFIINGMIYRIGYFTEEGNLDSFVPCYIKKKFGQVFRCTFRESVGRRNDLDGSSGSKLMSDASKISSVKIRATTNLDGTMTTNYKPLQTLLEDGTNTAGDSFVFEIPYSNKTNDVDVITSIKIKSIAADNEETVYEYTYSWSNYHYQDALAGWKVDVGTDAEGTKHNFDLFGKTAQLYKNYIKLIDKNGNTSEWLHVYDHTVKEQTDEN